MIDERYIDLVTAYLEDSLSPEEHRQLNELVEQGEIDIIDLKEMEQLYQSMGELPVIEPSTGLKERFHALLEAEKSRQRSPVLTRLEEVLVHIRRMLARHPWSYATGLFLVGLLAGSLLNPFNRYGTQLDQLSNEVYQMREVMMINLLEGSSATDRLKAVNISMDIENADDRIILALLQTLNHDPNVNVRLAAIDALLYHAENPSAREGLVNAITRQQSPLVQVALADAMLVLQEERSVQELRELLEKNGLNETARTKIETTIAALS